MRHTAVFAAIVLLGTSVAIAGLEVQDPAYATVHRAVLQDVSGSTTDTDTRGCTGTVTYTSTVDRAALAPGSCQPEGPEEAGNRSAELDWYPDFLVRTGNNFPGDRSRLSIDHADNGDIYVTAYNLTGAPQDTLHTYRSTDGGTTWAPWQICINTTGSDSIVDGKIVVGPGPNPWIYTFVHYATSSGGFFVRRLKPDGTGLVWTQIIAGDQIRGFDVDRNIENPMVMFLTYLETPPDYDWLRLYASYDSSETWTNGRSVRSGIPMSKPAVCAGGDGYVYLTWCDDSTTPWVGRYTNNLVSPDYVWNHPDSVAGDFSYHHSVCAARTSPGTSQAAWLLNRHLHTNGNYDFHVSYSSNGGETWETDPWPPTNEAPRTEWNLRWPMLRYPYDYTVPLCVATSTHGGVYDSIITAYSRPSTPDVWEDRAVINEHDGTRAFGSAIDCQNHTSGSMIIYRQYGSGDVWYDRWGAVGMAGEKRLPLSATGAGLDVSPNPVSGRAAVRYSLAAPGEVELAVFDVSGRRLTVLSRGVMDAGDHTASWNTAATAPGVYLVRLTASEWSQSERVVVAR